MSTDTCPWCKDAYYGPQIEGPYAQHTMHRAADGTRIAAWVTCPLCGCKGPVAILHFPDPWKRSLGATHRELAHDAAWKKWRER